MIDKRAGSRFSISLPSVSWSVILIGVRSSNRSCSHFRLANSHAITIVV